MKGSGPCALILALLAAPLSSSSAAFELRPTRAGGSALVPASFEGPMFARAGGDERRWSIGWLHMTPSQSTEVSLDAIAVSLPRRFRWGARLSRLGAPHYAEWMTQLSCQPHRDLLIAVDHLRSTVDANLAELGIRGRSATTFSVAAERRIGTALRMHVHAADLLPMGDAERLGVAPSIGYRTSIRLAGVELGHGRSWQLSERSRSEDSYEIAWTGHPSVQIGQSWGDRGSSVANWLRLQFDPAGVCIWRAQSESGASISGVSVTFTRSPREEVRADFRSDIRTRPRSRVLAELESTRIESGAMESGPSVSLERPRERVDRLSSWEQDPDGEESWSANWADSLWSIQDSLEEHAREPELDEGSGNDHSASPKVSREDSNTPAAIADSLVGSARSRFSFPDSSTAEAAPLPVPIPLQDVRGSDVARLLSLEPSRADSVAERIRGASSMRQLSLGPPDDPVRDLVPYLTASPASLTAIPASPEPLPRSRNAGGAWSVQVDRTFTMKGESSRAQARMRFRGSEIETRVRRSDRSNGWTSVRAGSATWAVMGGTGFGLPAPRDLWHQTARTRRATQGRAAWLEMPLGSLSVLASAAEQDGSIELSWRRPSWNLALARLPRDLGIAQLLASGRSDRSSWGASLVQISRRMVRTGAMIQREHEWDEADLRAQVRWEEAIGYPRVPALRLSAPSSIRHRRELLVSAKSRRLSADLAVEWRARSMAARPDAASDETRRWRLGTRARYGGARAEIRLARSHTDAHRRSETPFEAGTKTRDIRGTARVVLWRDRPRGNAIPGIELGLEQRSTNSGSWSGRWAGAWMEGRHRLLDWGVGLMEVTPAPGRTTGVTPRWVGGRRISVSTRSLLFGIRLRRSAWLVRYDLRAVCPLSPIASPQFELTVGLVADRSAFTP